MKIASIALKDFRAYHEAQIDFGEPLSIIRGANHAGKTTIKQALELALTRRSDGTTAAGAGSDDKIRQGAKKAQVTVTLDTKRGPVPITMSQTHAGRNFDVPQGFDEYLTMNATRFSCVLDPEFFIGQSEKDQKAILSALIAPAEYTFDPAIVEMARQYLGGLEGDGPVEIIDNAYSAAFKKRTSAKSALDAIRIPEPIAQPDFTVQAIKEHLAKLKGELDEERDRAVAQTSSAAGDIARAESQLEQKQRDLRAQQDAKRDASAGMKDADDAMLSGPQLTKWNGVAAGRKRFNELQTEISDNLAAQRAIQGSIEEVKELTALGGECPTCHQPLTDEAVETVVRGLESQIKGLASCHSTCLAAQKELGDITGAEAKIQAHEAAKQKKLDHKRAITAAEEATTRIGKEIVAIEAQLEVLRRSVPAAATEPKDRADLKAKIEGWEKKLSDATRYDVVQEQIIAAKANRESHVKAVADLERLVAYFGKDGVKADIIKAAIDGFTETINKALAYWGYSSELSVEPYRFLVTTADGKTLPLKELSGSERLMFGAALQSAIAIQSGLRLMVVDRADTFIGEDRGNLFTVLSELLESGELDQVIVLVSDNRTEVPEQAGVAFYMVGDGKVERLHGRAEQEAAA